MSNRVRAVLILFLASLAGTSCGGPPPSPTGGETTRTAALATDRSNVARAAYFAAEVARLREVARQDPELSVAYARSAAELSERVTTNYNEKLKAESDVLAAGLDRLVAEVQKAADFHTAEVTKELAR